MDNFTRIVFESVFHIETVITLFYMEFKKNLAMTAKGIIFGKWFTLIKVK